MSNINQCARCGLARLCEAGQLKPFVVDGDGEGADCLYWEPVENCENGGDHDDD